MIFIKWRKYYFHDPTAETPQVLYTLFHYCILVDSSVPPMVIMLCMTTLTISHLSSSQDGYLKNCKLKHLPKSVSLQNLAQCLNNTRSIIIKRRRYIPQKCSSTRYRFKVALLGAAVPHLFTSCTATQYKILTTSLPLPQAYDGIRFDSDSHQIGVNNHNSYSISNNFEHFTSPITPCNAMLLKVNGENKVPGTGTVCWLSDEDFGVPSKIVLQNTISSTLGSMCQ